MILFDNFLSGIKINFFFFLKKQYQITSKTYNIYILKFHFFFLRQKIGLLKNNNKTKFTYLWKVI